MKKLLKILGVLFLLFVLLIVGAIVTVRIMFPPERVRALVEEQLSKFAKREIQLKGASLSVFPSIGLRLQGIRISNTSRRFKATEAMKLWTYLEKENLKKELVEITLNGKALDDPAAQDTDLKAGDEILLHRKGFRKDDPLFSIEEIFVSVQTMPLLQRKVFIDKITLDRFRILVELDPRGSYNFDDLIPKGEKKDEKPKETKKEEKTTPPKSDKEEASPLQLSLNAFEIKNSQIIYANQKARQEIVLDDINQRVSVKLDTSMTDIVTKGLFEIKQMAVRGSGLPVRKSGMYFMLRHDLQVDLKKGALRLKELTVGFQKTAITASGSVNGFDKPVRHLDLSIKTNTLKLHDLFREVPPALFPQARKMTVKGDAKLAVTVKGTLGKKDTLPDVKGSFQLNAGHFKYADLPKAINDLNADIHFTQDSLDIKKLGLLLGTNPLSLVAKIQNFKQPLVDVALKANLDLGSLKDAVKLPPGVSLQGKVKADVQAKGKVDPKNPETMAVKGEIALAKIIATTPAVPKPVHLDGTFAFSNQAITLSQLQTKIGRTAITMELTIRDYLTLALPKKERTQTTVVSYSMTSPLIDLNELMGDSKSSSTSSDKPAAAKPAASGAKSSSTGDEPINIPKLPNVTFDGKIRVAKLQYKAYPITDAAINLSYKQAKIRFDMQAGLFTGKIKQDLTLDVTNPLRLHTKLDIKNVEANDFLSGVESLGNASLFDRLKNMKNKVYGKMDLNADIRTHGITSNQFKKNLTGTIKTKVNRAQLKNATILEEIKTAVPALVQKFLPKLDNLKLTKPLETNLEVKDGKIHVTQLALPLQKLDLLSKGTIGLDGIINMKTDLALNKALSRQILAQQKKLQKAAGGALGKLGGKFGKQIADAATSKLQLIPSDKQGRVVPIIGSSGGLAKLLHALAGFRGAEGTTSTDGDSGKSLGDQAKQAAKEQLDKAKKAAEEAARKAKEQAMKAANEAKDKALKAANEAAAKAKADASKAANEAAAKAKAEAEKQKADAQKKIKAEKQKAEKALKSKVKLPF
jgi:uncharacterized protein involved in outer membrane biogenesis